MRKMGLIGYPVAHSGSPELFCRYFANRQDILENYSYELIETEDFSEAAIKFYDEYIAVNVTTPYKEAAMALADEYAYPVERIMATNLLVKDSDGVVTAYNTDYSALRRMIPKGEKVVVIGGGGAAKAAAVAALENHCCVAMYNRTKSKITDFALNLKLTSSGNPDSVIDVIESEDLTDAIKQCNIVIYALSEPVELFPVGLIAGKTLIEANYKNPLYSEEILAPYSAKYIGGDLWLTLQAEESYRIIGLSENQ